MSRYDQLRRELQAAPRRWLVTGAAGFIGSHLLETLLRLDQEVVALDNFSTGKTRNLEEVAALVGPERWHRAVVINGDLTRAEDCQRACAGVDLILHQAALGSVPRSLDDPTASHASNVSGFLQLLVAAKEARVNRFIYASSSSVYGDHPQLPKREDAIGNPLSPYAATKRMNEIYADIFQRCYGISTAGLRYFNVFGPRQDPEGAYAAVIPRWFAALSRGVAPFINGDGETSRDFCFIANVVQANLLAAVPVEPAAQSEVYNIAFGQRTTLNELFLNVRGEVAGSRPDVAEIIPSYRPERAGDVRHSLADISRARERLGYSPTHSINQGLKEAAAWYLRAESSA